MFTFNRVLDRWLTVTTAAAVIVMMPTSSPTPRAVLFDAPIYGTNEIVEYWYLPIVALLGIPPPSCRRNTSP